MPKPLAQALRLAIATGDRSLALRLAAQAEKIRPCPDWEEGIRLGHLLTGLGQFVQAEGILREALRNAPSAPELWDNLGIALARQGRAGEAEEAHRRALELAPGMPEAHNNLGFVLASEGRLEEAERELREALRLRPGYALARTNLSLLLEAKGRRVGAGAP